MRRYYALIEFNFFGEAIIADVTEGGFNYGKPQAYFRDLIDFSDSHLGDASLGGILASFYPLFFLKASKSFCFDGGA